MAADSLLAALLCAAVVVLQQQRRAAWGGAAVCGERGEGGALGHSRLRLRLCLRVCVRVRRVFSRLLLGAEHSTGLLVLKSRWALGAST